MANTTSVSRALRRILSIVVATPVAVASGVGTVELLDALLPHSMPWQGPAALGAAFAAAILAGVSIMRAVGPPKIRTRFVEVKHPLDAD